jgi:superfamily II DNA or RNA helicase
LAQVDERGEDARLRGIVSLQTIRSEALIQQFEARLPLLDLVIIDEAHHLRNPETLSHRAGLVLSDSADSMILLTATPIHLGNENLFHLLRLLDEEEFDEYSAFDRRLTANEHVIKAQRMLSASLPVNLERCAEELRRVEQTIEGERFAKNPLYGDALRKLSEYDGGRRDHVIELQRALSGLNVLGHVFTRTRKAQVQERKATREPRLLLKALRAHAGNNVIIYAPTIARVDETVDFLAEKGIRAIPYHGKMDTDKRRRNQERARGSPDQGVALREVPRVGHERSRIERQRYRVDHERGVGAKYPSLVRAVRFGRTTRTTTRRQVPSRFGFFEV